VKNEYEFEGVGCVSSTELAKCELPPLLLYNRKKEKKESPQDLLCKYVDYYDKVGM